MEGIELKDFLRDLVEFLKANEIGEFELEQAELKVKLKFAGAVAPSAAAAPVMDMAALARLMAQGQVHAPALVPQVQAAEAAPAAAAAQPAGEKLHIVKSPMVGTFYEAPSPGSAPFVKVGDQVEVGTVLCILEAMKLMNEIESDVAGEIVERIAGVGQPVEYGQGLFAIRAR